MVVYKITNKIDRKMYIGQTKNSLESRWRSHLTNNKCVLLARALKKHGKKCFEIKIMARCNSLEEMNHREAYYIKIFNTLAPNGYNIRSGGKVSAISEESKRKMSKAKKGIKLSEAHKLHLSMASARKGKKLSLYEKSLISKANTGRKRPDLAERNRLMKGKFLVVGRKPIICNETGKIYESITAAAKDLGLKMRSIAMALKRNSKKSRLGYTFSYLCDLSSS